MFSTLPLDNTSNGDLKGFSESCHLQVTKYCFRPYYGMKHEANLSIF